MATIRDFAPEAQEMTFLNDMLQSGASAPAPAPPRTGGLHERIRETKRRLENERWAVDGKRRRLEELDAEIRTLTRRHEAQRRKDLERQLAEEREALEEVASGQKLASFADAAEQYVEAMRRADFCRPRAPRDALVATSESRVLEEFLVAQEGAAPRFRILPPETCRRCQEPLQLYQAFSVSVCPRCGLAEPYLDAAAAALNGPDEHDHCSFSNKRIHHFSEWLASIQAKENFHVPQDAMEQVMKLLAEERVAPADVTVNRVREALKKLKLRRYYEHSQLITCKLTGLSPPRMSPEMEEKIKVCFLAASTAFQRHCPPDRKNMISYQLVLLKLCELLGCHEFVPYFMLLKGRDKVCRMDVIWRKICEDLDWSFVPSA